MKTPWKTTNHTAAMCLLQDGAPNPEGSPSPAGPHSVDPIWMGPRWSTAAAHLDRVQPWHARSVESGLRNQAAQVSISTMGYWTATNSAWVAVSFFPYFCCKKACHKQSDVSCQAGKPLVLSGWGQLEKIYAVKPLLFLLFSFFGGFLCVFGSLSEAFIYFCSTTQFFFLLQLMSFADPHNHRRSHNHWRDNSLWWKHNNWKSEQRHKSFVDHEHNSHWG